MSKLGPIRVENLQSVIAGVGNSVHSDFSLKVHNVPPRDDGDLTVRELSQHLQRFLRLGRDNGQRGLLSQEGNCPVKVKDDP